MIVTDLSSGLGTISTIGIKNHHNKYAFTHQQRKVIGCALITGLFYQKGFGPWVCLFRDLNSTAFANEVEKMVKNIVALISEVGKKWFILPEWRVTLKVEYETSLTSSIHGLSFCKYTTNEGATEFKRLLEELTHTRGDGKSQAKERLLIKWLKAERE